MNDASPTPFDLFDLSQPLGKGVARKATVAEAKKAVAASTPADRTFGGLFFAMFRGQDANDVRRWLDANKCWQTPAAPPVARPEGTVTRG